MTRKEKLIEYIKSLPDDLEYFTSTGDCDDIDIRVFVEPKSEEFFKWYFGP